jgi:hypothetical protein
MSATALPNFGACWSCVTDVVMPSTMATGFRCVGEAIARRWQTPTGGLVDDPTYGYDLTDYVGDDLNTGDLARIAQAAGAEAQKDERVLRATVNISLLAGVMTVAGLIITAAGPFRLVASVSSVTVTLLEVTPA